LKINSKINSNIRWNINKIKKCNDLKHKRNQRVGQEKNKIKKNKCNNNNSKKMNNNKINKNKKKEIKKIKNKMKYFFFKKYILKQKLINY